MHHTIEFIGTPGSGKTTLVPEVRARVMEAGLSPIDLDSAVIAGARGSRRDSLVAPLLRSVPDRVARRLVDRSHERYLSLRDALVHNPGLIVAVADSASHREVTAPDVERAMTWMLDTIWQYELWRRGPGSDLLVLGEGFGHRAVTLLGYEYRRHRGDFEALKRYISAIPCPSLVIRVETDPALCFMRAGVPVRFRQLEIDAQKQYILDAAACIEDTAKLLTERGVQVRTVTNNESLDYARSQVGEQVEAWLALL